MNRIGKRGKYNLQALKKLKELFHELGITKCEVGLDTCLKDNFLTWHHFKKRRYYYSRFELLSKFSQVLCVCLNCHDLLERDKELSEQMFTKLRGKQPLLDWLE